MPTVTVEAQTFGNWKVTYNSVVTTFSASISASASGDANNSEAVATEARNLSLDECLLIGRVELDRISELYRSNILNYGTIEFTQRTDCFCKMTDDM
jgi:hypothetical protein